MGNRPRLMWKDMTQPVLVEEYAGVPAPTRRPDLPTDVSESVTVTGRRLPDTVTAPPASQPQRPGVLHSLSVGAEHASRFLEGQKGWVGQVEKAARLGGLLDLDNFARVGKGLKRAGNGVAIAGEALGAADDYRNGMPLKVVVPGAILHGGANLGAGALLGGGIGFLGGGPLGMAAGGIIGSYLADKYLPDRKAMGEKFNKAMEESAERPYYHGPS